MTSRSPASLARPRISTQNFSDTPRATFHSALRKEILRVAEQHPITAGELSPAEFSPRRSFRRSRSRRLPQVSRFTKTRRADRQPRPDYLSSGKARALSRPPHGLDATNRRALRHRRAHRHHHVGDFRPADIALGGQGAPLVPYADYLLYRHKKLGRVSLNLGGIANITVIPPGAKPDQILAFDTGPANMLIDALVAHFTRGRQRFDKDARLARSGRSIPALLDEMMRDPYLKLAPPKSTGREYYGHAYLKKILALGKKHSAKPADLIRAATIFAALSVVDALNRFVLPKTKIHQLVVSGGGAKNPLVVAQLSAALGRIEIIPSSRLGIPEDAKEAFAFALLAYETFHHRPSNLPSATGAHAPAILGKISYAPPR